MLEPASINHPQPGAADLVAAARQLGPLIRDCRGESERERRLPAAVLSAMHEARLFRMYVPIEYGGLETDPITSMQGVEAVAAAAAPADSLPVATGSAVAGGSPAGSTTAPGGTVPVSSTMVRCLASLKRAHR